MSTNNNHNNHHAEWHPYADTIRAISQAGMTGNENLYSVERYTRLMALAAQIQASIEDGDGGGSSFVPGAFNVPSGVATPKVDVRAACFRDGRLLMVQERMDNTWALPGGWADVGDVPAEAAIRETLEEAGFECIPRKIIGVFDANRNGGRQMEAFHAYKIIFLCDLTGKQATPGHESIDVQFIARDEMPPLEGTERTTPAQFRECFAHLDDPNRPTWFD